MFSKACEYALRALLFLASVSRDGKKASLRQIAAGIDSPEPFVGKILQDLARKGLLRSAKGPTGGFYLTPEMLDRSLADVVTAIDGDKLFTACGLGLKACSETTPCPIHHEFKRIRADIFRMLQEAKIGTFSAELDSNLLFLKHSN